MSEFNIHKNLNKLLSELPEDKKKFIDKHSLVLTEKMFWITIKENSFPRKICRHQYLLKTDLIGLLFRVNEICFAKLNYFRANISLFEPYIFDFEKGFIRTELWDADFFRHKPSGFIIDFRLLQKIKKIEDFRKFCDYIEHGPVPSPEERHDL